MMNRKHRAGKRNTSDSTASYEYWLKDKGANVANEWYLRIDLSRILRLADNNPSDHEYGQSAEPAETRCEWEDPKFVGMFDISPENPQPQPGH